MILTREEYEQIVRQKAKAESEAAVAKSNAAAAIEQADRDAQRKIREAAEETQEEINKIHQDLSEAESKIKYWQGLNENLLRISKERANADRKLKPKKEHTGYVVVSSTEKEYRYKVNRRDFETVMLWETVLQTPYPIDFTEEQAREETKELIGNDGRGNWLIARLGINTARQNPCGEPSRIARSLRRGAPRVGIRPRRRADPHLCFAHRVTRRNGHPDLDQPATMEQLPAAEKLPARKHALK